MTDFNMEPDIEKCGDVEKTFRNRRSSILKTPKVRNPFEDIEITETFTDLSVTKPVRRVSFASSNFVKPFVADPEKNTIWDTTYEEDVNHTNSTQSSQEHSTKLRSTMYNSASLIASNVTNACVEDMEFTQTVPFCDKENIPICQPSRISIVDCAKKRSTSTIVPVLDLPLSAHRTEIFENLYDNGNVTQGMEFTCQNFMPLIKTNEELMHVNHAGNYTIRQETEVEFTEISLHKPEKNGKVDASAMEFTCQMPVDKTKSFKTTMSNESHYDMEFTCQVPQNTLTKINGNQTHSATKLGGDMEFTCQVPQNTLTKTSVNNGLTDNETKGATKLGDDMELTCQVPQSNLSRADDNIEFMCEKSQTNLTKAAEDMELTRQSETDVDHNMELSCLKSKINLTTALGNMEFTCQLPQNEMKSMCRADAVESNCQIPLQDSFPDVHMMTIDQTPDVSKISTPPRCDQHHASSDCKITDNGKSVHTVDISQRENISVVGVKDASQTKNVSIKDMETDNRIRNSILSQTNLIPNDENTNITMNLSQPKCPNKVGGPTISQTEATLSKTAMGIDATINLTQPRIPTVKKVDSVIVDELPRISISQSKNDLSNKGVDIDNRIGNLLLSQTKFIPNDENTNITMNLSQPKCLNRVGVAEASQTEATNLTQPQIATVKKVDNVTLDELPRISVTQTINTLSITGMESDNASNFTVPKNTSQIKCVPQELVKDMLSQTSNKLNKSKDSILNQISTVSVDESRTNPSRTEPLSEVDEVEKLSQMRDVLSKSRMTFDNTADRSPILKTDTECQSVTAAGVSSQQKSYCDMEMGETLVTESVGSSKAVSQNIVKFTQAIDCNKDHAKYEAENFSENTFNRNDLRFDMSGVGHIGGKTSESKFDNNMEVRCQIPQSNLLKAAGDVEFMYQKSPINFTKEGKDLEIPLPNVTKATQLSKDDLTKPLDNIEFTNQMANNNLLQDQMKSICQTNRDEGTHISENSLVRNDLKLKMPGESIGFKMSQSEEARRNPHFSKIDHEQQKENIVSYHTPLKQDRTLYSINITKENIRGAQHTPMQFTPKSPKMTNIPIRANSTLLNTPERLSRFQIQTEESDLNFTCDNIHKEITLEPTFTLTKHEYSPLKTPEPSFHINLTNISSGVDDTQHLIECTYSKSNPVSFRIGDDGVLAEKLDDMKVCPDISSYDLPQNCGLSKINDTYALKRKQDAVKNTFTDADGDGDTSDGIISDDLLESAVKDELNPVPCKIKRVSEISDLLGDINRQRLEITKFLENVKFRRLRIPTKLTIYENSSSDNSESIRDPSEDLIVSCPSLEDKIRKHQESCQNCWKLEKIEDEIYHFSTLFGALVFKLQIDESDHVYNIQTVNKLSGTAKPIARFILKLLLDRLNDNIIKSAIGEQYDILSFLDYVQMTMLRLHQFQMDFMSSHLVTIDEDFVAKYTIFSIPLVLSFEILVDISDLENLQCERDVTIMNKIGTTNEREVKNLAQNCPKGIDFFTSFEQNIQEYLKVKAKRKGFERTHK